jgi:Fur family zinc uptake transcriptional regulator
MDILAKVRILQTMTKKSEKSFQSYCARNNLRITPPRLSAFKIVHSAKRPITAYDLLEQMGKDIINPKPPTAYRALYFLTQHGFAHRIESLNAYVPCDTGHKHTGSQFMICDSCGQVEEIHLCTLPEALQEKLSSQEFCLNHWNIEAHGSCSRCRGTDPEYCEDPSCKS